MGVELLLRAFFFIVVIVFCVLRLQRYCGSVCPVTASSLMRAAAGGTASNGVDVYNGATGAWSTAQLSVGRMFLAAASVGNVALFAGGYALSALLYREGGVRLHLLLRFVLAAVFRFCLPCDRFLSHARHCRWCSF